MALLDGHDGTSLLFHLDGLGIGRGSEKLLGTAARVSFRATSIES